MNVIKKADTAKCVIEDKIVIDGDRECVNRRRCIVIASVYQEYDNRSYIIAISKRTVATGNIFIIVDVGQSASGINKNILWPDNIFLVFDENLFGI